MNLQSLVAVLLRLASLDFMLQMVVQLIIRLESFGNAYERFGREEFGSTMLAPLLVMLGLLIGTVMLWVWAMPIARFVTRGMAPEVSLGALTLADCYALVFVGLGLFYVVGYFAPVLNWSHYLLKMEASRSDNSWRQQMSWYDVSRAFITFILGIILIVNGRKWAVALAKKHSKDAAEPIPRAPESETTP